MIIAGKEFKTKGHTYVMGILNVTPDSFSDGGTHNTVDAALLHTERMLSEGADIIDVGGESTRPGHIQISIEEEIERTAGIIERLKKEFNCPISIDSYKAKVAKAALDAGADLVNDIWGLKYDEHMAEVIADYGVVCCLMHNRQEPLTVNDDEVLKREYLKDMQECLDIAARAGINKDRIILDPGVGFGKTYEHNLAVLRSDNFMMPEGYPVLLGTSRKSVIGLTLDLPVDERVEGTLVTTVQAVMQGAMFVRVHDVKENVRAIKMTEAIYGINQSSAGR